MSSFLRRPPYGISWWTWHVEPRLTRLFRRFVRRCVSCGQKGRAHKLSCSVLKRRR